MEINGKQRGANRGYGFGARCSEGALLLAETQRQAEECGRTSQGKKRGLRVGPDWRPLPGQAEAVHESGPALGRVWEPSVTKSRPLQADGAEDERGLSPQASHVGGSSVVIHDLSVYSVSHFVLRDLSSHV